MAEFGTLQVYEEMAKLLNDDPVWADKGKNITYTMTFAYTAPINRTFFMRFDEGKIVDVRELSSPEAEVVDFLISGEGDIWRGVLEKRINPTAAMTRGQLKVKGKMTALLKNMNAFNYIIDSMTKIELV